MHLSLIILLQIPLLHKPTRKALNLQPRECSIQIALREIIASFGRGQEHLQFDTTSSVALYCGGSECCADAVDVVDDERLESLFCEGKMVSMGDRLLRWLKTYF